MAIHIGRRLFLSAFGGAANWPLAVHAQQPERVRRIGVLMTPAENDADAGSGIAAFRQELHERGWSEGRNLQIDYRWGGAHSTPPVKALLQGTRSIPIVFLTVTDPLSQGLVASLAHPGVM
jgi:putative tryptophan/tyrosine transport system substrate-binding protein